MITTWEYFNNNLIEINLELYNVSTEIYLQESLGVLNFDPKSLTSQYNNLTRSFPYEIIPASDKIGISLYSIELNHLISEFFEGDSSLPLELINSTKESRKGYEIESGDRYIVYDLLENYFQSIVIHYKHFIKNAKKEPFFSGIRDETIILKNLLILYKSVTVDKTVQLNIFYGITLTKAISDKVVLMLIDFIEQRLLLLNPELNSDQEHKINYIENKFEKIEWLGTQQDLVELFHELSEKEWIVNADYNKRLTFIKSILLLFDIENTKRSKTSDSINSMYKKFNGEIVNGKRELPFLEKDGYKRKFNQIKRNC